MALLPKPNGTVHAIYNSWEVDNEEPVREFLGASDVGICKRAEFYAFRWAKHVAHPGQLLALFDRGKREEAVMISRLRRIGCTVHSHQPNGKQFEFIMFGGHFRGHPDGMVLGLVEAPKTWHVAEFKTHNEANFNAVVKKGVKEAQPKHYAQCQWYMGQTSTTRCAYFAINKNDDEIHLERIEFSPVFYKELVERASDVIFAAAPPARISNRADWWQCKMCKFHSICHQEKLPQVTCRSCAHSTPVPDGTWKCERRNIPAMTAAAQIAGCEEHRYIPIFFDRFATIHKASDEQNWVQYEHRKTGEKFVNGPSPGFSSQALRDVENTELLGHPVIEQMKAMFPEARIINEQRHPEVEPDQRSVPDAGAPA